jgi:two-component system, OmpR family, phosphate regulon sensor histidine kinase PhoR
MLRRVQERLQEMLDVIADLLELARLKQANGKAGLHGAPGHGRHPARGLRPPPASGGGQGPGLQVEVQSRPCIVANREHMRQIWTNLISNAIKYTPQGGRVWILAGRRRRPCCGASVQDSGIGIAEEDMRHLFQEFFRTEEAKASGQIGTGLGLSIVKQIIDSYGGKIEVASRPGTGLGSPSCCLCSRRCRRLSADSFPCVPLH